MFPIAYINKSEKFFKKNSPAKTYLIQEYEDHYLYEVQIVLDLQNVITSKVRNFKIYLTDLTSTEEALSETSTLGSALQSSPHSPAIAAAEVLSSGNGDLFNVVMGKSRLKKHFVTSMDPKKFIDLERYKNNFKGSAADKFGYVSQITTFIEKRQGPEKVSLDETVNTVAIRQKFFEKVESGMLQGVPITEVLDLKKLRIKKSTSRHVITKEDSAYKESNRVRGELSLASLEDKGNKTKIIPEFDSANRHKRQRMSIVKSSNTVRVVSFLMKLKKEVLTKSEVNPINFGLLLEAQDKKGIILDRMVVGVNLKKDLDYKFLTLEGFGINITEDGDSMVLNVSSKSKTSVHVNLYNKALKKDIAFYENSFDQLASLRIPPSKPKAGFKLLKNQPASPSTQGTPSTSGLQEIAINNLNVPNYFRITPRIKGYEFDNMYEVGVNSKNLYTNRYVPMYVSNTTVNDRPAANIFIDTSNMLKKYKKIKIFKKDLSASLYGSFSKNLKPAFSSDFVEIGRLRVNENPGAQEVTRSSASGLIRSPGGRDRLLSVIDTNVEPGRVYTYRVELFEEVGRVGRVFSSSFFQEKIESPSRICNLIFDDEFSERSQDTTRLRMNVRILETDAEKVFKSLLKDKYDLFKEEISEIGDVTSNAIALKIERINLKTCQITTLDYISDIRNTLSEEDSTGYDANVVNFEYLDAGLSKNTDYVYKVTVCLKPISEIIAGINEEIQFRRSASTNPAGRYSGYRYAALQRRIRGLDDGVLYNVAASFARAGIGKKSLIVDAETAAGISNENSFSNASTGDIFYFSALKDVTADVLSVGRRKKNSGLNFFDLGKVEYYSEKSLQDLNTTDKIKNKFIINFKCSFMPDIDHCSIFISNRGQFEHCCDMHVANNNEEEKTQYRVLVEKFNLKGNVSFYMFPITKHGAVLPKVNIGSYKV